MPIYEYRCARCGQTFERLMRMGATEAPPCPDCGAARSERLVSAASWVGAACASGAG